MCKMQSGVTCRSAGEISVHVEEGGEEKLVGCFYVCEVQQHPTSLWTVAGNPGREHRAWSILSNP